MACRPPTAITPTVTAAAGRFAPGHLCEPTAVVPFELVELVDAVLAETARPASPGMGSSLATYVLACTEDVQTYFAL
ncbi:hypothetical protein OG912_33645 [Streptomyces sp. NBC_00464]|uniref:hypothetical protein n=1 Tax=Streptomyces sp. NBC_00464 TaxID=2975751 RepID=UPI002E19EB0A